MSRLKDQESKVREILEECPRARDDDRELTLRVWVRFYKINPYAPVIEVMRNRNLPSQESLGRVRRKLQMGDETLRGSRHKEKIRFNAQKDYLEYAGDRDV